MAKRPGGIYAVPKATNRRSGLGAKPVERPAPRNYGFERQLAEAMDNRLLVELRYEGDAAPRLFQPEGLYRSSHDKVCVAGVQVSNPNKLGDDGDPRQFEVGKICSLRTSEANFVWRIRFDRSDPKYKNGVIHSALQG